MTLAIDRPAGLRTSVVRLTERHGVNHELSRDVWINPAQVTRFHEYTSGFGPRVTMIRFGSDDFVWVEESPELVAAELGWS